MLLSHKYKFIFIKTRKTAGTSIEVDLSKVMGPDDVVTRIQPPVAGHCPRNFRSPNLLRRWLKRTYHNHAPARIVREVAGRAVWDSYYTFCVEREPVAKAISMWRMIAQDAGHARYQPGLTWDEYAERGDFPVDAQMYLDAAGGLMVDRILKYETLDEELLEVTRHLGIEFAGLQARAKGGVAKGGTAKGGVHRAAQVAVTPAQRQRIYDAFAPSLRFTGYTPDPV